MSIDQKVFEDFSAEAQSQNKTLFAFTNEWLSVVSDLSRDGWTPTKIHGIGHTISLLKEMDVITLPSDFVDELIAREYNADKESLLKMFRDMGSSLVGLLKIATPDIDGLTELAKEFIILLPVKQLKVLKQEDDSVEVDIVGAGRKKESAECTFQFLEAILNGYGYSVSKHEIGVGMLRVWAYKGSNF